MITYTTKPAIVEVRLDKKLVGHIKPSGQGYAYFPVGARKGGLVYVSIESVKRSLEGAE